MNTGLHRLRARLGRFDGQHQLDERDRRVGRTRGLLAGLGLAWSFGTWTGLWLEFTPVSIWLAIFGGLAVASLVIRKNRFQTRLLLVLATTTLAGSRASLHVNSVSRSIIPAMRIADGRIISVEGTFSTIDVPFQEQELTMNDVMRIRWERKGLFQIIPGPRPDQEPLRRFGGPVLRRR